MSEPVWVGMNSCFVSEPLKECSEVILVEWFSAPTSVNPQEQSPRHISSISINVLADGARWLGREWNNSLFPSFAMPDKRPPKNQIHIVDVETFQFGSPNTCIEQKENYRAEAETVLSRWIATF
jgi:hypothetical protein